MNAGTCPAVSWLSFRRIIDIPFKTCVAALESWQRTGHDGELHIGQLAYITGPSARPDIRRIPTLRSTHIGGSVRRTVVITDHAA